jgi:serralysin
MSFMATFNPTGWKLTFSDEFKTFDPVGGPWMTTYPWTWSGLKSTTNEGNNELQAYVSPTYKGTSSTPLGLNPFSVVQDPSDSTDGMLKITAQPTPSGLQQYVKDSGGKSLPYTSGMISSYATFEQKYGYFEMRADIPSGMGMWPAFWMLPKDLSWPPELDVMESIGKYPTTVYGTAHYSDAGQHKFHSAWSIGPDLTVGFHTYGAEWNPKEIIWYLDGQEYGRTNTPPEMNKSMYLIANLAVGGDWPGSPDAKTPFPAEMQIDYIKAYTKDASAPQPTPAPIPIPTPTPVEKPTFSVRDYSGNDSANTIIGNDLNNTINGNGGNDIIKGGNGNDRLTGGGGNDKLWGGAGNDTFVFSLLKTDGFDMVMDFQNGDKIDIHNIDANTKISGNQDFKFIESNWLAKSGDLGFYQYKDNNITYVQGDINGDGKFDFNIGVQGLYTFKVSDFIM